MASTADFRNGLCIEYNNDLYTIVEFQHVKPGKGAAFVRTKLKSMRTGRVIDNTFNSGVKVNTARIERRPHQFVYHDGQDYQFMNLETYEQIPIKKELINAPELLFEGQEVDVLVHAETEETLTCELPQYVVRKIVYTEPGVKGDTATNTLKPATVEGDAEVNVPLFINEGDVIKIDTANKAYMERVKK